MSQERLMKRWPLGLMKWCNEGFHNYSKFSDSYSNSIPSSDYRDLLLSWNLYFFQDY